METLIHEQYLDSAEWQLLGGFQTLELHIFNQVNTFIRLQVLCRRSYQPNQQEEIFNSPRQLHDEAKRVLLFAYTFHSNFGDDTSISVRPDSTCRCRRKNGPSDHGASDYGYLR